MESKKLPAYCNCNFDNSLGLKYGKLYNWYAVENGKVCPEGWHVPTVEEWRSLKNYLGNNAGDKLKEAGTSHWLSPNTSADNSSGFTALPACIRHNSGLFENVGIGFLTNFWRAKDKSKNFVSGESRRNYLTH